MAKVGRWFLRIVVALQLLIAVSAAFLYWYSRAPTTADEVLFVNGSIEPVVGQLAEALHIRDGRIIAIGSRSDLEAGLSADAEIVDLQGGTLLPGLIEPHTHPITSAMLRTAIDVSGFSHPNRAAVIHTLKQAANGVQFTDWVIAFGWDPVMVADLSAPTLAELDEISPDKPLLILTQMMHDAYLNSAALAAAGINDSSANPVGGEFLRDAGGKLTGTIREVPAINAVLAALPKPPSGLAPLLSQMELGRYAAAGYTTIAVLGATGRTDKPVELMQRLTSRPDTAVRSVVWALPHQLTAESKPTPDSAGGSKQFALRGVKFWMDGSPFAGGAAWAEPYENSELVRQRLELPENHQPELNYNLVEFQQKFADYHQRGFHIAVHVQGERAVDNVLNAAEAVLTTSTRQDHRHRLEHNALITEAQIKRAKQLGFTLSFFVDHIWFYGDRLAEIVGAERQQRYMPLATALAAGHKITLHGDHPATPINPLRSFRTAVERRSRSGKTESAKDQALTRQQAIAAMTINAAWQLGLEAEVGSLESGKAADLLWLSDNPMQIPLDQLQTLEVQGTWIAGRRIDTRKLSRRNLAAVWALVAGD